jgi:hypothetical protein
MKKVIIIISIICIFVFIFILGIFLINKNYTSNSLKELETNYNKFYNYITSHEVITSGTIDVNANYRGAHGENYPNAFTFEFTKEDNKYTFINEKGYYTYEYDNKIYELLDDIRSITPEYLDKIITISNNKINIDIELINELTNSNIKSASIKFNSKGLIKKLSSIDITIDDLSININGKEIKANYLDNNITIKINDSGYYLNINNKLKMNAFLNDNKNLYSVVIGSKTLTVEITDDILSVIGNSEAAIYNSLELTINNKKNNNYESDTLLELNDIPMLRYYTNNDLSFWN